MKCRVFQLKDAAISEISSKLGRGKSGSEKARLARQLAQEADSLLACVDHNGDSQDCKNCHALAARRKRVSERMVENLRAV
jgi:hypothetical protein